MAIRINRVYTRAGDDGRTALVGGRRVPKDDARIAAYGDVDELNSVIGVVRAILAEPGYKRRTAARRLDRTLAFIQQELFDLGSELATAPDDEYEGMIRVGEDSVARLEDYIDELQPELAPLKSFVLPGGGSAGAMLHLARTVCRRAERAVVTLTPAGRQKRATSPWPARYLNRLSDLLFVQSRWIALKTGKAETMWQHGLEPPAAAPARLARRGAAGAKRVGTAQSKAGKGER